MLHHKNAILIAPNFATHCGGRLDQPRDLCVGWSGLFGY